MFHCIIFFISGTHHKSKVKISKITPAMVMVIIFVGIFIANLKFSVQTTKYAYTKSDMLYKHHTKKSKIPFFHILLLSFLERNHLKISTPQKGRKMLSNVDVYISMDICN